MPAMTGMQQGMAATIVLEDAERVAMDQLARVRRYLRVLDSIAQIAPLLGLFGTVIGMMSAFQALQTSGADADPAVLAGGIWVALITTAVGLAVAIPTSFALYWFEGRIDAETTIIESLVTSLFTGRLGVSAASPGVAIPAAVQLPSSESASRATG
ncbi:MAG: MotA/TolQ/ExbB proton channel family protein [Pseudomonadota bacterium]